jgi:hypothetical protein
MHRPFYALIVLLETLAGSLLLVKSASSQSPSPWSGRGAGTVVVHVWRLSDDSTPGGLGEAGVESIAGCLDGVDGDSVDGGAVASADRPSNARNIMGMPRLTAIMSSIVEQLDRITAGIDRGVYRDAGAGGLMVEGTEAEGLVEAPASEPQPELSPLEAREAGRVVMAAAARAAELAGSGWSFGWTRYVSLALLDETSSASGDDIPLTADTARQACGALWLAAGRCWDVARIEGHGRLAPYRQLPLLAGATATTTAQEALRFVWTEFPAQIARYHEDAVLIQAAVTLDQIGSRLQQAARQLRKLAAQRVAHRRTHDHVALRSNQAG